MWRRSRCMKRGIWISCRKTRTRRTKNRDITMKTALSNALRVYILITVAGCTSMQTASYNVDAYLESTLDNVVWGYIPPGRKPIATVRSGQTVRIDTLSHQPISGGVDPLKFFAAAGVGPSGVVQQMMDVYTNVQRPQDAGAHVLTGPIYVEGAEPGDMLEVRVRHVDFRVPFGVNNSNKGSGALPELHTQPAPKVIKFDL